MRKVQGGIVSEAVLTEAEKIPAERGIITGPAQHLTIGLISTQTRKKVSSCGLYSFSAQQIFREECFV